MPVTSSDPVALIISPRAKDIGDFSVRRALPDSDCYSVGPFVFFDQMGPVTFTEGQAMDVRPHPHIGIATITWLFAGEIRHQDSLGINQVIRPGEVNWMTAGKGIVHSERSPDTARNSGAELSGIQAWIALPKHKEEMLPAFHHYTTEQIPCINQIGSKLTLIAGQFQDISSPVHTESETFYAELALAAGSSFSFPVDIEERAIYICSGDISVAGKRYEQGSMLVLKTAMEAELKAEADSLCMLLGGGPLDGPRKLWWNFVSSRPERIEQAKADWTAGRFSPVPGDEEFIPLPE